jgi:membrane associated rhomboid family serine protease
MLLPLGDSPNPRGVPVVTYALVGVNVAVYVLISLPLSSLAVDPTDPALLEYVRTVARSFPQGVSPQEILANTSAYDLFVFRYGFRPAAPHATNLLYSLFLHAGFLHLFGNMLFLWIYGDNVEHRLGRVLYLLAYLGTGVVATLFHTVFDPESPLPLIGASGAISGVLGFYFLFFPRNQVRLLVLLFPFFMDVFLVPARWVLGMYLVLDNLLPFLLTRGVESGGVAHGAHIGGFIAGLGVAWLMDRRELRERPPEYRGAAALEAEETAEGALRTARAEGRMRDAARAYFAIDPQATRRLLSPEESLALGEWLRHNGHAEAALVVFRRHLRDYPSGPGAAEAHLGAGLVQLESFDEATAAYQHFLDALDFNPPPEVAARIRTALAAIAARQKFQIGHPYSRGRP